MAGKAPLTGAEGPDDEAGAALQTLLYQLTVARATDLARAGRYADAESVLFELGEEVKTAPAALDLLARMRAQQGDLPEAERLWTQASKLDPSNTAYQDALVRVVSRRQRSSKPWVNVLRLACILGAVAFAGIGGWILLRNNIQVPYKSENANETEVVAMPPAAASQTPAEPSSLPSADFEEAINVQGLHSTRTDDGVRLEFDEGLFVNGVTLKRGAHKRLDELGASLRLYNENTIIEIIGTTDATPVSRTSHYRDNIALGVERARVIYDYLRSAGGIKAQALKISSRGEQLTSPNNINSDDPLRSRTVILHISKRQ